MKKSIAAAVTALALVLSACSPQKTETAAAPAAAAPAPTPDATMQAVIAHHVTAVKAADVEGVLADYADDAILSAPPGLVDANSTFVGKENVRKFFVWLATPAVLPGAQSMTTTNEIVGPNTLLFRWTQFPGTPKEVKGYDVFVFRDGKIVFQMTAPMPK